jgi:predicted nuclease of predicted toxin-antitoxin system
LTPTLEGVAHERGYEATSNRRRGLLAAPDSELFPIVVAEDWVLVTNNEVDFRKLAVAYGLHPGLVILPQGRADQQRSWLGLVIDFIEARSEEDGEEPRAWMTCRVVIFDDEVEETRAAWLPDPPP